MSLAGRKGSSSTLPMHARKRPSASFETLGHCESQLHAQSDSPYARQLHAEPEFPLRERMRAQPDFTDRQLLQTDKPCAVTWRTREHVRG